MAQPLSSRFLKVLNDIPPEAQQTLLEKSLSEVLDQLPPDVAKKVYSSALKIQTKHQNIPKLDLKGKRKQVNSLLDILHKESKMYVFSDRTSREEIVSEIVHSLTGWLNDIWSTIYEHHMQYAQGHECLMFVAEVLTRLDIAPNPSGCKCDLLNLPIRVTIKDKAGKIMYRLRIRGPQNLDKLLLWMWRDLLLCILAKGSKQEKEKVTNILGDLEAIYGFPALERVLDGGAKSLHDDEEEEEEEVALENETQSDAEYEEETIYPSIFNYITQPDLSNSSHWGNRFTDERVVLRRRVEDYLFSVFSITPTLPLYDSILNVSLNPPVSVARASTILAKVAGSSSDTLTAALSIEVSKHDASKILSLLDQYSYLLRPRDAVHLQCAAAVLGDSPHHARGISLLETGLQETLADINAAVRRAFIHIDESTHKKELTEIIKLRSGSQARRDRIDAWAGLIMTSPTTTQHGIGNPMAAMMFGIPMMLGMPGAVDDNDETSDLLNFIDLEGSGDADLEDIREEFRPQLKRRFEGWTQLATVMKGGATAAGKAYTKAVELMPFLRATDVVNEMVNRLGDRPGKAFVCDALESVSSFCKTQRKKLNAARKEKEKQATAASRTASAGSASAASPSSTPAPPNAASSSGAGSSTAGAHNASIPASSSSNSTPAAGAGPASGNNSTGHPQRGPHDGPPPLSTLPFSFRFSAPPLNAPTPPAAPPVHVDIEIPFRVFHGMEDVD